MTNFYVLYFVSLEKMTKNFCIKRLKKINFFLYLYFVCRNDSFMKVHQYIKIVYTIYTSIYRKISLG